MVQRATAFGERRSGECQVQLWKSTRLSQGSRLPHEWLEHPRAPRPPGIVSPLPPAIPAQSFSSFGGSSFNWLIDYDPLDAQAAPPRPYSLARVSTVTSSSSSTSTLATTLSSLQPTSPTRQKSNRIIQVDLNGTEGVILDRPDPPRMVVFFPDALDGGIQRPGYLLVIDSLSPLSH